MRDVPAPAGDAVRALHLRDPWVTRTANPEAVLHFADRAGLSLFLPPEMFADREVLVQRLARNRQRLAQIRQLYTEVSACLRKHEIAYVFLKGLNQCELSGHDPERRVQYDIDLLTTQDQSYGAAAALAGLGFEPFHAMEGVAMNHLPPLIRRTGWEFRGDYFDPEIPTSLEVHFRLWNRGPMRLDAPGLNDFFARRHGDRLAAADALGFSALHLLKHLLLGSVRAFHVYELACILEKQQTNSALWNQWRDTHDPALRRLECVAFQLAREWFGCPMPEAAQADWLALPPSTRAWFERFASSPLQPANKDELWLHCSLINGLRDRAAVVRRRMVPMIVPRPVRGVHLTPAQRTLGARLLAAAAQAKFMAARLAHHATAAVRLAGSGARWWRHLRTLHG